MAKDRPCPNMRRSAVDGPDQCVQQWAQLLDSIPFYVLLVDDQHQIVAWNRAMRDKYGIDDPSGAYCPRLIHGTDGVHEGCPLEQAVVDSGAVEKEIYDPAEDHWLISAVYPTTAKSNQGRPLFLHFTRDITAEKRASLALELSLEHHKAIGQLLQRLSVCPSPDQTLEELVELTLGLSWMKATCGAAAFLVRDGHLELVRGRSLPDTVNQRCSRVALGECVCGQVALTAQSAFVSSHSPGAAPLAPAESDDHGHAALPLVYEGNVLGVVNFYLGSGTTLNEPQRAYLVAAAGVTAAALAQQLTRQQAREAQARATELERSLLKQVIASQEEERRRVARELHDDLGQALSALLLDVKAGSGQVPGNVELCHRLETEVRELISKVYQLAWDLRPAILDDFGLDSALSRHINKVSGRTGLAIDYEFIGPQSPDSRLPPEVEVVLYRVTQEALNNVVRHASATRVSVIVLCHTDSVVLMVEDDGRGFDPEATADSGAQSGLGITGMRERVGLLKGELVLESAPGVGTSVKATIPLAG
ncbi:MAG: GAF domain-containing protein [Polyangiaceae bacterium]|nr:GAF domain-containing protein [Polyangiaceae bacterium]